MSKENDLLPNGARVIAAAQVIAENLKDRVCAEDVAAARAEIKEVADELGTPEVIVALAGIQAHLIEFAEFSAGNRHGSALRKVRRGRH